MPARKPSTTPAATISMPPKRATSAGSSRSMRGAVGMGSREGNDRPSVRGRGQLGMRDPDPNARNLRSHRQLGGRSTISRLAWRLLSQAPEVAMWTTFGLLSLLAAAGGGGSGVLAADAYRPRVQVWTDRGEDPYASGQGVRVHFRAEQDAYVTIIRIDTDGRVRVLFPREPWEDNFVRGARDYEVQGQSYRDAFSIDDYPGVGYIFAIAAADPFSYDGLERNDHWDYRVIANGRVHGDTYVAVTDLAQRMVPDGYSAWDYDVASYYVQQHYDYPRFLCYDCHSYVSYSAWRPYDYTCVRFRIVVFDDPYYYPYRTYGDSRVVFTRPLRPEPRFIFKDRQGSDAFITRVRERPVTGDARRRDEGVRGGDIGGTGVISPPRVGDRQRSVTGGGGNNEPGRHETGNDGQGGRPHERPNTGGQGGDHRGQGRPNERPDHPTGSDQPVRHQQPDRGIRADAPAAPNQRARGDRPEQPSGADRPTPRAEPRRDAPAPRAEPRPEPRPEPRAERPASRPEPRVEPRAAPPPQAPRDNARPEPELKRRKP